MTSGKKLKSIPKFFFGLVNFAAFASTALAQDQTPATPATPASTAVRSVPSSFSVSNLTVTGQNISNIGPGKNPAGAFIIRLINNLSLMIGSLALLTIIIGGVMFLTSGGKEGQITKGKDIIKYAVIGLVVAFSAYFITSYVQSIFYEYGTAQTSP